MIKHYPFHYTEGRNLYAMYFALCLSLDEKWYRWISDINVIMSIKENFADFELYYKKYQDEFDKNYEKWLEYNTWIEKYDKIHKSNDYLVQFFIELNYELVSRWYNWFLSSAKDEIKNTFLHSPVSFQKSIEKLLNIVRSNSPDFNI